MVAFPSKGTDAPFRPKGLFVLVFAPYNPPVPGVNNAAVSGLSDPVLVIHRELRVTDTRFLHNDEKDKNLAKLSVTKVMSPWAFKFIYSTIVAPLFQPRHYARHWGTAVSKNTAPVFGCLQSRVGRQTPGK